jgi:FkbM family methyltransferase
MVAKAAMLRQSALFGIDRSSMLKIDSFNGFEMAYRQSTADESVLKDSFDHDIFFPGAPEYQPGEADVIIDIGAHIGTFAVLAASKVPRGAVHALEACEDTFNFLRINAALNRRGNLHPHHLALFDRRGTCTLHHDSGNWGHSVVRQLSDRSETVECCTLQQFFAEAGIQRCSFIKFNCEGAEFPILLASPPDVLRRARVMLVLYHCDLWSANSKEDLFSYLEASGFRCTLRNCTQNRGWIIATNPTWDAG